MAGVVCPMLSSTLSRNFVSLNQQGFENSSAGAVSVPAGGWGTSWRAYGQPLVHTSCRVRPSVVCKALDKGRRALIAMRNSSRGNTAEGDRCDVALAVQEICR